MPRVKVVVPDLPVHLVSRPRLLSVLDRAREAAVTAVCAPAGFGKTLLLAEWAQRAGDGTISWISLDSDDNDDRRFWSVLLSALATNPGLREDSPVRTLEIPDNPSSDPAFLAEVVDALDELPQPVSLVLDDLDQLRDPRPLHGLRTLLRHRPSGLRVVLSSRAAPPLPLGRLRLSDDLAEIGAKELNFTFTEARALFTVTGAEVTPAALSRLVEETEGWAVGLRLAAASVACEGGLDGFLAGHDRALREYLEDELLQQLPGDVREFLRAISIRATVTPALAAALSGRPDAEGLLHELSAQTMMVVREDRAGNQYAMPALLRSYLLAELSRREPDRLAALHALAADWAKSVGHPAEALAHAAQAMDTAQTQELLRRHAIELFLSGAHSVLRRAFGVLDDRTVAADPLLALVVANLYLEAGEVGTADLHLAEAQASMPPERPAEVRVLWQLTRSRRAQVQGDLAAILRTAAEVDPAIANGTGLADLAALQHEIPALVGGDPGGARDRVEAVLARAENSGQDHVVIRCHTMLAALAAAEGDLRAMTRFARAAEERRGSRGQQGVVEGVAVAVLLGFGELLRGEPGACVDATARIARILPSSSPKIVENLQLAAETLRGAAAFELGDWREGLQRMRATRRAAERGATMSAEYAALCAVLEHRAALQLGAGEQAREVLHWSQEVLGAPGEIALMRARTQLSLGRHASAANVLRPLLEGASPAVLKWSEIEGLVVGTQIATRTGTPATARRLLGKALTLAESADIWHPLVFAEQDVITTLTGLLGKLGTGERFAAQVLARRTRLGCPPVPVPLTERERSVLRLLPTMRSIDEIAEDLTVSPNTVKTHVRGIYTKLNVRRRRDAVAVAVAQGLLDADLIE
ncbi:LuxR C-terminal-related transcriptional regulator [Amycolatopsis acididurans]|uniref:LuxR C-terminal-related transcriptional regulator n=1 Tax=Amycolatopsis acididurans TaxID=2724524 RepID=UPI0028A5BC67|nr:LuxR C-terminal-related transcriptional regulator [Amycolatopsis acididurans]